MFALLRCVLFTVLLFAQPACAALRSLAGADDTGQGWSMVRLDLDIWVDPASARLELTGWMRLRLDADASLGPTLGVNQSKPLMSFLEAEAAGAKVELNATFPISPATRLARFRFDAPKRRGDEIEVTFRCASEGHDFQFIVTDSFALASWVSSWYPIPLPKTLNGLSQEDVAAPGRTRFAVPDGWTAVSNGRRTSKRAGEVVWESSVPVARSFAAGPFEEAACTDGGRDTNVFLIKQRPATAGDQARTLGAAIRAMEKRFGSYPYASYSIVEVPAGLVGWYASSEQGFIMAETSAFDVEGGNVPLFAHEAAHGWWGNKVHSRGPGNILCSESLAQYGAVIAIEEIEGVPAATEFLRFSRRGYNEVQCARGYFELLRRGEDQPLAKLEGQGQAHNLSDSKGHWVFHMLRDRLGDATFFGVLKGVLDERESEPLTLDGLRGRFLAAAPDARLQRFFADWLDRKGAPILEERWSDASDASGARVKLAIEQRGEPYDLDLEVDVEGAEGTRTHRITIATASAEWTLASPGTPSRVTIDPRHRVLMWTPEYGAKPSAN